MFRNAIGISIVRVTFVFAACTVGPPINYMYDHLFSFVTLLEILYSQVHVCKY